MSEENWIIRAEWEAAERLDAILAMPDSDSPEMVDAGSFDPWEIIPCLYGSYSSDFDQCAIDVLTEIHRAEKVREDLGAEMFREMLCNLNLCSYGTSPRVCFATSEFKKRLPLLLERWKRYAVSQWGAEA